MYITPRVFLSLSVVLAACGDIRLMPDAGQPRPDAPDQPVDGAVLDASGSDAPRVPDAAPPDAVPPDAEPGQPDASTPPGCVDYSLVNLGLAPQAEYQLDGARLTGDPGWLVFVGPGIGVQGMFGDAVEDSEELRLDWTMTNAEIVVEWYASTPIWIGRIGLGGGASVAMYEGGSASFASAEQLTLWPDTSGMMFLTRVSYCLPQ